MRNSLLSVLALLLLVVPSHAEEVAPGLSKEAFAKVDVMVDKAMVAYNANNWKAFFADYAKMMSGMATPTAFDSLYKNNYKKKWGNYKSKKLNPAKTSVTAMNGVVVYDAVFDKGACQLDINIFEENGAWKLQQVQMNPKS